MKTGGTLDPEALLTLDKEDAELQSWVQHVSGLLSIYLLLCAHFCLVTYKSSRRRAPHILPKPCPEPWGQEGTNVSLCACGRDPGADTTAAGR